MALTILDKKRILGVLKLQVNQVSYYDFFDNRHKFHNDIEVLNYLIDVVTKKLSNEYSPRIIANGIYHIICFCRECVSNDDFVLIYDKLHTIDKLYLAYITEHEDEIDDELNKYMKVFRKVINRNIEITQEENSSDEQQEKEKLDSLVMEYLKKIEELEKENQVLRKQVAKNKTEIHNAKVKLSDQKLENKQIKSTNQKLERIINGEDLGTEKLKKDVHNLKKQLEQLEKKYQELILENNELKKSSFTKDQELQKYQQQEQEQQEQIKIQTSSQKRKQEIEQLIIKRLLKSDCSISDIHIYLRNNNINISQNSLYQHLLNIKQTLNIHFKQVRNVPIYSLNIPSVPQKNYHFTAIEENIDLLVLSNLSIIEDDQNAIALIDKVYEYCIKNGIHYIVNLGSFFQFTYATNNLIENIDGVKRLIETIANIYPRDPSIINLLLGSKNDEKTLQFGINAIQRFCNERIDFVDLGFNKSTFTFTKSLDGQNIDFLAPTTFTTPDMMDKYLLKGANPFISLIGSTSTGYINLENNYAIIPSIKDCNTFNGAYHLKINVGTGKIKNIIFIPLILQQDYVATSKVYYTMNHQPKG